MGPNWVSMCVAALGFDLGHQIIQPGFIAAARKTDTVAFPGKLFCDVAANTGTGAKDQADRLGHSSLLKFRDC